MLCYYIGKGMAKYPCHNHRLFKKKNIKEANAIHICLLLILMMLKLVIFNINLPKDKLEILSYLIPYW